MGQEAWAYSDIVKDHFTNPRNVLEDEDSYEADGKGYVGNPTCGDAMLVVIKVDKESDRIKELKWKTYGCASALASTSMMSVMLTEDGGMILDKAYKITPQQILERLGGLPSHKIHCSVLGDKALREAIDDYYKKSGQGDKVEKDVATVICHCLNVTDKEIEEEVLEGSDTFEKLQEHTKISTACGKCRLKAIEVFEEYRKKYFGE
ncbi:MAG: iron-sulfur cluster assembly scaffold protein [Candidatus Margulisiibacteriota bacterium]|nr:MAG: iron-sulfur cluster assembly scaffold protein [Candidatus Margulisbacteria bacterium GWD2_39_127]OGI03227.1 MAG: iron-sulfur cluster assembly scaffold protein [Candidatus Margulisbacteria bacterium GWF2_38_17]OGI11250.1 MAG: iron-sulfur cluster assembly scaffold protein [Candidatus Margulisbacteria bacterium GWE2_39_32]PZM78531.1 MAG: iron-sulfur cluster assembly scaffold protein [Candidatus Margulisiibacteriota bacterium]HAR63903.1 iron-sulfur cluster assembly scaffold protein [Candida